MKNAPNSKKKNLSRRTFVSLLPAAIAHACTKLSRAAGYDGVCTVLAQSFQKFLNRSGAISV